MRLELRTYQREAVDKLKNGAILDGSVGSGKSLVALYYYFEKVCGGSFGDEITVETPRDLYIITTAKKRDDLDWDKECTHFNLSRHKEVSLYSIGVTIDSWNNIKKYVDVKDAFFIFDEQRLVGSGAWVKTFLKISKKNKWILLSATPGDTWMDYVPVFIANGFYKNRTAFKRKHVVYNRFTKYPKIDRYIETGILQKYRRQIIVKMDYTREAKSTTKQIIVGYDKKAYKKVTKERWDIYEENPIKNVSKLFYLMRKVVNSSDDRIEKTREIIQQHDRLIIFYNFDYELEILRTIGESFHRECKEWNGHVHDQLPTSDKWIYLVQYTAGSEGWNCITTNVTLFYSQNYSYKIITQASGRTDRMNTPYDELLYYRLRSNAPIDVAILQAFMKKKKFNESDYIF